MSSEIYSLLRKTAPNTYAHLPHQRNIKITLRRVVTPSSILHLFSIVAQVPIDDHESGYTLVWTWKLDKERGQSEMARRQGNNICSSKLNNF